jgi:hypothetical protein
MKTLSIEMPVVGDCTVTDCAYNLDQSCHARAITVGDGVNPGCDTYFRNPTHAKEKQRTAGVGACKVAACQHNNDFECGADSIHVSHVGADVNCITFAPR